MDTGWELKINAGLIGLTQKENLNGNWQNNLHNMQPDLKSSGSHVWLKCL